MNVSFGPIDHPLIIIAQAICAVALFRLFFLIHKEKQPIPQIVAGVAFAFLTNLTARVAGQGWFWIADIFQYTLMAVLVVTALIARSKVATTTPEGTRPVSGLSRFFEHNQSRLTWGLSVFVLGLVVYSYLRTYNQSQTVAIETYTRAAQSVAVKETEAAIERERIIESVNSLNDRQDTTLSVLNALAAKQDSALKAQKQKNPPSRAPAPKPAPTTRPQFQGPTIPVVIPPSTNTDEPQPKPKKSIWRRIFGHRALADSTDVRAVRGSTGAVGDTLVLY